MEIWCKGVKGEALPGRGVSGGVFFMGVCVKYYVFWKGNKDFA